MSCLTNMCHPFILIIESTLHIWGLSERNKVLGMFSSVYLSIIEMQMDRRGMVAQVLTLPAPLLFVAWFWHFTLKPPSITSLNCTVAHCQSSHWLGIRFPVIKRVKLFSVLIDRMQAFDISASLLLTYIFVIL